ncbi:hypothetical protein N7495_004376 [Penicillium taxi]|uniref:uncharacterized protein n=1 Tax=Penicillium taxi TaxID=168475 RepID=UPI0025456513|nr:uncharacterized protein N7495_004376 [Penicillium taxi]KAJ5899632.1 hypothetical protein N7495_004376 [Penicillium taxi]
MATDYSKKTNADLVEVLKARSLPHTGKKADLVARLQQDDDKSSAPASAEATKPADNTEDVIDWDDDEPAETETVTVAAPSEGTNSIAADKSVVTEPVAVSAEKPADAPATTAAAETEAAPAETTETAPIEAEKKPAVDYTRGLPATELEEELRKRKARAEKFGTVEDSATALKEAEKAVLRAKRFSTGAPEVSDSTKTSVGVKGLDEALSSETQRNNNGKRVRTDRPGPGGKRPNLGRRHQRGNGNQNQSQNQGRHGNGSGGQRSNGPNRGNQNQNRTAGAGNKVQGGVQKPNWSEKDTSAMEARKKRFATAT